MDSNFSNTAQSYKMAGQAPLDAKMMVNKLSDLLDLGEDNNKAFTYHRGMIVFCHEAKNFFIWIDEFPENIYKLLPTDFQYPNGAVYDGEDYSYKKFNFVKFIDYMLSKNLSTLCQLIRKCDVPPFVTGSIVYNVPNRQQNFPLEQFDFEDKYYDANGDAYSGIRIKGGELTGIYKGNGQPLAVNDFIPLNEIGNIKFNAKNQNPAYEQIVNYVAVSSNGVESN